jgi:hypothetical protein
VALSYDPKVDAFCHSAGQPVLQLHEVTRERLDECLTRCLMSEAQQRCQGRFAALRAAAVRNFDILLRVLDQ